MSPGASTRHERKLPPVTELGMLSLALIVADGIYLASNLPESVPLGPAIALLAASALVLAVNLFLLSRVRDFAWGRFFEIGRWAGLAYTISAGLIGFTFIHNGTRGGPLVVLLLSLVIFVVHLPVIFGFTVARYADR